jgi:quinol monooxygenase YgiN
MIIATLRLKVLPEKRWDAIRVIHSVIEPTLVQKGCIHCGLYSKTSDNDELILLEEWESKEGLEKHIRSDDFKKVLTALELASENPEINFHTVSSSENFELVEKLVDKEE